MDIPRLPKDVWAHIRSFSGPNEPTPTAEIINDSVLVRDDTNGACLFPDFGRDGYASTVVLALSPVFSEEGNARVAVYASHESVYSNFTSLQRWLLDARFLIVA